MAAVPSPMRMVPSPSHCAWNWCAVTGGEAPTSRHHIAAMPPVIVRARAATDSPPVTNRRLRDASSERRIAGSDRVLAHVEDDLDHARPGEREVRAVLGVH